MRAIAALRFQMKCCLVSYEAACERNLRSDLTMRCVALRDKAWSERVVILGRPNDAYHTVTRCF